MGEIMLYFIEVVAQEAFYELQAEHPILFGAACALLALASITLLGIVEGSAPALPY